MKQEYSGTVFAAVLLLAYVAYFFWATRKKRSKPVKDNTPVIDIHEEKLRGN